MRVLGTSGEINQALLKLLRRYRSYSWAVAWASAGSQASDLLLKKRGQIRRLVVGTHFHQTDPDFMDAFVDDDAVRFVLQPSGVFHPKIYLFEDGDRWTAVVGSPNFTHGGLGGNEEVALLVSDEDVGAESARQDLRARIEEHWKRGSTLTISQAQGYRAIWKRMARTRDRLGGAYGAKDGKKGRATDKGKAPLDIPILLLPWPEFYERVRGEAKPNAFDHRRALLHQVRKWFQEHDHFSDMDLPTRQRIAGTTYEDWRETSGFDWLWFGSMKGAGHFKHLINENDQQISAALDCIPADGDVHQEHFQAFTRRFEGAFSDLSRGGGGIATATRLLAMKRPDYFVCLDSRNRRSLCKAFGMPISLGMDRYWDSLVERITGAAWWSADKPSDQREQDVWMGRAALLDALFYEQ